MQRDIVWYEKQWRVEPEPQIRMERPEWPGSKDPFGRGGKRVGRRLPLFGIIWYTFDQGNPTNYADPTFASSSMRKGYNWLVWRDALINRILGRGGDPNDEIQETLTSVYFKGEAILDLASMLDVVALGHWPAGEHIQEIKSRSKVDTRVVLWSDHESISQAPHWSNVHQIVYTFQRAQLLFLDADSASGCGGGTNGYGCTAIDKYETSNQSGGPCGATYPAGYVACPHTPVHNSLPSAATTGGHTWDVDISDLAFVDEGDNVEAYIKTYYDALDSEYLSSGKYTVDGFAYDNCLYAPYKGTAYNSYGAGWSALYVPAWKEFLSSFQYFATNQFETTLPRAGEWSTQKNTLWANCTPTAEVYSYSDLQNRYVEHFFRKDNAAKTLIQSKADLDSVGESGVRIVLGVNPSGGTDVGQTYYWATTTGGPVPGTHGTWREIIDYIWNLGIEDQTFAPAVQTFSDAYIFHQEGWRVPV